MAIVQFKDKIVFDDSCETHVKIPVHNYIMKQNLQTLKYELFIKDDFKLPKKLYGDFNHLDRWLASFTYNTGKNMGIILTGQKGGGKTIDAQLFCKKMNMPVIMVTENFSGPEFIDFITNPELGECIIFIDEFEKIYGRGTTDESVDLLSIMDGNYNTKLLFLLTVNDYNLDKYLINRLGRIKYRRDYSDLEDSVIEEVIGDMLDNKSHKDSIYKFFEKVNMKSFDLLINIIKEMNLFKEDALECGKHLNLKSEDKMYDVYEIYQEREYKQYSMTYNPFNELIHMNRNDAEFITEEGVDKSYTFVLKREECIITQLTCGMFTIEDPKRKIKFRFQPQQTISLIF